MRFALGILTHTPLWVFALLAYLVWQGIRSLRPRTTPIWRLLIVPAVFIAMGLSRIVSGSETGPWPLLTWLGAAQMIVTPIVFYPFSKVLWLAGDLVFRPAGPSDFEIRD